MSKIDLSKAKVGDKFRTRIGEVLTYKGVDGYIAKTRSDYHICARPDDYRLTYFDNGKFIFYEEHPYDLVEQVFDNGDLLDNNISAEEGRQAIVEMAKNEYEKAKELGVAIQNLPLIVEQQKEENLELQRRQEVIALAEKLVVNEEMMKSHKDLFEAEVHNCAKTLTTYTAFVIRSAEDFIKHKNQYLKDGKL